MRCEVFLRLFPKRCQNRLKTLFFVFPCCLLLVAAPGCQRSQTLESNKDKGAVAVSVITIKRADVPVSFEYIAQVESSQQVNIEARVSGFLDKRVYTEGSVVRQGQKLFLMDQKPFKAQLDQAEAALARRRAALQVARLNLDRVKPLAAASALSQKDLDDAVGKFESASAAVAEAKANVEQARLNLSYTVITSPLTGISSDALQADGTYLHPTNSLLTTVALISPVYVNFSISENEWLSYNNELRKGLLIPPKDGDYVAEVVLSDGTLFHNSGKLTFANPSYNAKTGTFLIRATVENPKAILRPNQYVHVRLMGALRRKSILVPQRAVQQTSKGHIVWVVEQDGRAEPRPVTVGAWHGNDWFIDEGLDSGDRVVVDGVLKLRPGSEVQAQPLGQKEKSDGTGSASGK